MRERAHFGGRRRRRVPEAQPRVRLIRADTATFEGWPDIPGRGDLDPVQEEAVRARGPVVRVYGAPGTGKSAVAQHAVADRIHRDGLDAGACLLVTSSRVTAADARRKVSRLVERSTGTSPAMSMQALGFAVLSRSARRSNTEPPRLLDGAEQDVILADLLAGHAAGAGPAPDWPTEVEAALETRGFRAELRDVLMRAVEYGVSPTELERLGNEHGERSWPAVADVLHEYDQVTALSRPGAYDPSWVLGAAAGVLLEDDTAFADLTGRLRVVVVDDAQEITAAASTLLAVLASGGVELVLIGDPDAATQTFRGADPRLFGEGWEGVEVSSPIVLPTRWRQNSATARICAEVASGIGVIGTARHRAAVPPAERVPASGEGVLPPVTALVAQTPSAEEAHIAALLRREHLLAGRPWSDMAVVVRGSARTASLRRSLTLAGVPVDVAGARLPLREETAVRPLLAVYEVVLSVARRRAEAAAARVAAGTDMPGRQSDKTEPGAETGQRAAPRSSPEEDLGPGVWITLEQMTTLDDLLGSPLLCSDPVSARRARRALLRRERECGGERRGLDLLAAALLPGRDGERTHTSGEPELLAVEPRTSEGADLAPVVRLRHILDSGLAASRTVVVAGTVTWASGVTCEQVLWALWSASGVAGAWQATALSGAGGAARADRDLDAVLSLFEAASAYVTRLPRSGPDGFLEHIVSQDVAADSLVARGQQGRQVTLTTPQGAVGREWGLVVAAGLQEGVWPDTRLRGSLLGSERLVDVLTRRGVSVRAQLVEVLHDEARLFCSAVGRARDHLVVTAVNSEDEQPSVYLDLVRDLAAQPPGEEGTRDAVEVVAAPRAMSMTGLVGELRRRLTETTDGDVRERHAARLARLAQAGVPGADPVSWWPDRRLSTEADVLPEDARVRISPSRLQTYSECPLRWFLSHAGGEATTGATASTLGSLVHDLQAAYEGDHRAMVAELERRWPELSLPPGWTSRRLWDEATGMVDRLVRYQNTSRDEGWRVVAKEIDLAVDVGRADVRGRIDRLEADPQGRLRVIDVKTGRAKPSAKEVESNPQLGVYQAAIEAGALSEFGAGNAGAALVQIGGAAGKGPKVQAQRPLADHDRPDWAIELITQAGDGMVGALFPARPGDHCRVCPSRRNCPAQTEGESL